jgi:hypothetical protein
VRPLKIVIPPRAGQFSTLRFLASLQRRNSRFALKQSSLRALKLRGQGAPKNLQCTLPGSDFKVAQRSGSEIAHIDYYVKDDGNSSGV